MHADRRRFAPHRAAGRGGGEIAMTTIEIDTMARYAERLLAADATTERGPT
jgi:hypothetical protein